MTPTQARALATVLIAMAKKADADGKTEISMLDEMRAMADAARDEFQAAQANLQAAIDNAAGAT